MPPCIRHFYVEPEVFYTPEDAVDMDWLYNFRPWFSLCKRCQWIHECFENIASMPLGNTNDCIPEDVHEEGEEPAPGSASAEPNILQTFDAPAKKEEHKLPTHLKTK